MMKFEAEQPRLDGPRAAVYEFARKYRLSDKEAERLFLKLGASATQEAMLAEARLPAPEFRISAAKSRQS
ncbi:hypothetical protein [Rhizobium sp. P28RR-XV]|uniref:hypothetical protein n=1 Tax=Rhizobium sp. P28RR-XV TaxID=2726737 RepID=UPI0014575452|nr:hypothetical protein [Rhizobium sp. P28RR-XV]NLR88260.1 hypothetical protein [Rhizobium sp. P28RR-XV]